MSKTLADAFVETGLACSRGGARRLAYLGGLAVNGVRLPPRDSTSVDVPVDKHLLTNGDLDLQTGKRRATWSVTALDIEE